MSLPSTWIAALPSPTARANTPTTRSAKAMSAALGVKTRLTTGIWSPAALAGVSGPGTSFSFIGGKNSGRPEAMDFDRENVVRPKHALSSRKPRR